MREGKRSRKRKRRGDWKREECDCFFKEEGETKYEEEEKEDAYQDRRGSAKRRAREAKRGRRGERKREGERERNKKTTNTDKKFGCVLATTDVPHEV